MTPDRESVTVSLSRDILCLQPPPPAVWQTQLPDPVSVVFLRVGAHFQPHHRREDQQVSGQFLSVVPGHWCLLFHHKHCVAGPLFCGRFCLLVSVFYINVA